MDPADVPLQLPQEIIIQRIGIGRVGGPHLGWPEVGDIGLREGQAPLKHVAGGGVLLESVGLAHGYLVHPWRHHGLHHVQVNLFVHIHSRLEEVWGYDVALVGDHPQGHDGGWVLVGEDVGHLRFLLGQEPVILGVPGSIHVPQPFALVVRHFSAAPVPVYDPAGLGVGLERVPL